MAEPDLREILAELTGLRSRLVQFQVEVAAVRHPRATEDRLSSAALELDAIVDATEGATNGILATAEEMGEAADALGKLSTDPAVAAGVDKIQDLVARLFTECAFQDITGQRVAKVVGTLRFVEQRIGAMIALFGEDFERLELPSDDVTDADADLLNGPATAKPGVSQSDIDNLFG